MDRDRSWQVIDEHRVGVADILAGLTPEQWEAPSLCDGWRVREVGAHLSMAAMGPREVLPFAAGTGQLQQDDPRHRARPCAPPARQIVADLRGIVGTRKLAPFTFWRDPLFDILVHAHDIARPLGITVAAPVEAARTAADWAWSRRFPFFPAWRLRGLRLVASDVAWERGDGLELRGPVESLLLVSTGRPAGLAELDGPGLELAESRLGLSARP